MAKGVIQTATAAVPTKKNPTIAARADEPVEVARCGKIGALEEAVLQNPSSRYFDYHGNMEMDSAVASLDALAQKARLGIFRHLVQAGPPGACPGDIAQALGVRASTLSFHLKALHHAGLVTAEQSGRSIIYRADFQAMQGLVDYLTENCCGGDASLCAPQCAPARPASPEARAARSPRRA